MDKQQIRAEIKAKRSLLTKKEVSEKSQKISLKLFKSKIWQEAKQILIYKNFRNEVETGQIIKKAFQENKQVFLAKIDDFQTRKMSFRKLQNLNNFRNLETNKLKISQPKKGIKWDLKDSNQQKVLIILPLLAFDKFGNRVGWGGGFYDIFIQKIFKQIQTKTNLKKVGIGYNFQQVKNIQINKQDQKLDFGITENRFIRF